MTDGGPAARRSPLHDLHASLGARFVDFGGWEMPVRYQSVIAEHRAVRTAAGWFDVSHLGRFRWEGPGATEALRRLLCNDIARIEPGRAQYSLILNDDGGTIDDLIVWRWADEVYWVLPNAANHIRVMDAFSSQAPHVEIEDLRPATVTIAVQGPDAPGILEMLTGSRPRRFRTFETRPGSWSLRGAGTGYTGESGGEVVLPAEAAAGFVTALVDAGVTPCGLGARDTLRLEAGLPLWGNDLDESISPLEAGLDFAVAFDHDFVGRGALELQREGGLSKRLTAFRTSGGQIPRHGQRLRAGGSRGWVSSGNYSPMLECGIGVGFLSPPSDEDPEVEIRDAWVAAERVDLPFVARS